MRVINGENKFEIGYILFVKLLRMFTNDPQAYIFATALITFVGTYIFINQNCKGSYSLSLLIFLALLYYTYFSAIRQSIAMAIAINSFPYICDKKWIKASLLILLAATFHDTALVLLVFVPFSLTKWTKKKVVGALFLSLIGVLLFNQIIEFALRFFPIYERYLDSGMMKQYESHRGTFAILVAAICIFSFAKLLRGKNEFPDEKERTKLITALTGAVFCIFINILGLKRGVFSRMTRYFIPSVIILTTYTYINAYFLL